MFSTAFVDGLVLAAIAQDDRHGPSAGQGLAPQLAGTLRDRLADVDALTREQRHEVVRALVSKLAVVPTDADLSPRVAAILAPAVPREIGRRWAASAPEVRRGFRVTRSLRSALRRLAAPAARTEAGAEERRAAARVETLEPARAAVVRSIAAQHGGDRALGALMLGIEGSLGGDGATRRLRVIGSELALVWGAAWRA